MEPIAIVGMAALFPGAADLDEYWQNLRTGRDAITDVPTDRWDAEFYDPDQAHRPDRVYCRRGGFVDENATFEPLKFGMMPNSVGDIEPDQLIALEVAAAAIADAGGPARLPDSDRIGVILGRGGVLSPAQSRYTQRVRMSNQVLGVLRELVPQLDEDQLEKIRSTFDERLGKHQPEGTIGLVPNLAASRVANRLNLRGPAYTIDAACASSLLAVDQGVAELAAGRLDAVLAGGVHHVHDISFWSVFSQLKALSRAGVSRPFDAAADGLLIGEGTGMVVLKRLADAERAGDRVYAVIRGIGTSSDGRSASMFNPASSGQVLALRRAWADAGLDPTAPDALGLIEAHGTGTPTGDAAELTTLAEVFGPPAGTEPVVIGSVKSMIGHTMPAAGIAGLIKATLAVHHATLLPTLHCGNPRTEMARTRFAPIDAAREWRSTGPRRAAVNAFGFGGINAHVIIEQYEPPARVSVTEPDRVVWLAAPDHEALSVMLDRDATELRRLPTPTGTGPARIGIVDPSDQRLGVARKMVARGQSWRGGRDIWFTPRPLLGPGGGKLAFVFPGLEAEFAPRVADVADHFGLPYQDWVPSDLGQHGSGLVEVGRVLDHALRAIRIRPDAVAGHSIGEWTAAVVSGQMSTQGVAAFLRAFDAGSVEVAGYAFAAITAPAHTVTPVLAGYPGVVLTHDNAPTQCVINGPRPQVQRLVDQLRADKVLCQLLPFRSAFHTPVFAEGLQAITSAIGKWEVGPTEVPVWSGLLAAPFPDDPDQVNEIFARHMVEPVRFRQTVTAMHDAGIRVFLQVGAGQLASLIDDVLRDREHLAVPVNLSRRDGLNQLRRVATALWVDGGDPDLGALDAPATGRPAARHQGSGVVVPTGQRGPAVRLNLADPLVKLGLGAAESLGGGRPSAPPPLTDDARHRALTALDRLAGKSSAAAELAALLAETADHAVAVIDAANAPRPAPTRTAPTRTDPTRTDPTRTDPSVAPGPPSPVTSSLPVSLATMPYLIDHCFFVQPADWPTVEDRRPVVAATTIVQFMMDFAGRAAGDRRVVGVREAKFNRWLLAEPAVEVEVTVRHVAPDVLAVELGQYARGLVDLAPGYPAEAPARWTHDPATERPPTTSAAEMYTERLMFHGPQFQGVTAIHALGDRHVRGTVTQPRAPGALLDNALQTIGNWLITTQPLRTVALPVELRHIRFFGPPQPAGTRFETVARIRSIDDRELVADLQLWLDGRVWAQIDGAVDRRFDTDPATRPAERFPDRYALSVRHESGFAIAFDRWSDPVTRGMTAFSILGTEANAEYERMMPARRRQWLLGRIAAKDAVRFQQQDAGLGGIYPIEVAITNDATGRPEARVRPGRGLLECDVSLAHCAEVGVALAVPRGAGAPGIDVVEVTDRAETTHQYALTAGERELLDRLGGDRALWFARFWAAKEAVGKSLGTGLDGAPRKFVVTGADLDVAVGDLLHRVEHTEIQNPPGLPDRRYVVAWTRGQSHPIES
ncbi:type I polyketide synthase [Paractinoplanes ferrugineus]|uniref:Polyketide synthase n=1 Tax=Paractinoplanes ferrugineus TaxID=113564 RepID=A0A919ML08_9ACTN|nr:beta-ketoacyl synthase N-terminal-like domain-containing protein [Actinoplanes ferrugineus]GIE16335.1 polyketide synthase [Actinoplanes ferrugineus]